MAFFYKDVPPFELQPGNTLAFDTSAENDADIQLAIALAPTTANGSTVEAQPFKQVVSNTQTAADPNGDAVIGNFDLRYTSETDFSFAGGGLAIRFSNPSAAYQLDTTCTETLVGAFANDPSGFFFRRAWQDPDGVAPWNGSNDVSYISSFQVTTTDPPPAPPVEPDQPGVNPPNTLITKGPKDKTRKNTATFEFTATEAAAAKQSLAFQCKLDGGPFEPCTSPKTYKVKKGKHTFQVQASIAGLTDPTPATDDWKRKKRKK
jgi:hypothetical protein